MKFTTIILLTFLLGLMACKNKKENYIRHVVVNGNRNTGQFYNNGIRTFYIDLDRNGTNDMTMNFTSTLTNFTDLNGNLVSDNINSFLIVENPSGLEVAAIDDCIEFLGPDVKINDKNLDWELSATIATNNIISFCNTTLNNEKPYFVFRVKRGNKYRYGWMRFRYDIEIDQGDYQIEEWAVHMMEDEEISTGQTDL